MVGFESTKSLVSGLYCSSMCNFFYTGKISNIVIRILGSVVTFFFIVKAAMGKARKFYYCDCSADEYQPPPISLAFSHCLYGLAAIYGGMVATNWGYSEEYVPWSTVRGIVGKWVNICMSFAFTLLYLFVIAFTIIFKDREYEWTDVD